MAARNMSRIALPIVTTLSLFVAACGGDSSTSDSSAVTETTTVQTTVETTVPEASVPEALVATELLKVTKPVAVVERSADDEFMYVLGRDGYVYRYGYDGTRIAVSLNMANRTKASVEGGLLGLAFLKVDSAWYAYVHYTDRAVENTLVDEYLLNPEGDFIADSRRQVLTFEQPYPNHNGGDLKIGPDNMLYIASGDGGDGGDPQRFSMKTDNLLGKILRIDPAPTATTRNAESYNIPADNPFVGFVDSKGKPAREEIWAVGFRNPWRIDIDESGTLWIADVGQNRWEEISMSAPIGNELVGGKGANFGWSAFEGTHVMNPEMSAENHTLPVFEYPHENGYCSISGGTVIRANMLPGLNDWYLYSDYCNGQVSGIKVQDGAVSESKIFTDALGAIVSVQQTSKGVFVVNLDGPVYRLSVGN